MTEIHDFDIEQGRSLLDATSDEDFVDRAIRLFEEYDAKHYRYIPDAGGSEAIKIGDRISFYYRPYQHSPRMVVTKINNKSVIAYEVEGSYQPGTRWTLHKEWNGWEDTRHDSSFSTRNIPTGTKIK